MTFSQSEPRPGRSLLESVIRFLVWSMIIGCIAMPLLLTALIYSELFAAFPFWRGSESFRRTVDSVLGEGSKAPTPKIVTGVLEQERARQIARLAALTGHPELASGAASSVQFIAVVFEGIKPDAVEAIALPRQRVYEDGYRRLTLDMAQAQREAVVLTSEQPIRWTVAGLQPRSWPRLGFEGYAAFDIADGQPGSLAGFRIGAFGATDLMRAADPTQGEVSIRHTFCKSVQTWVDHFGIAFNTARFTLLLNPTRVAPRAGVPSSDGEIAKTMFGDEIERLCKRRLGTHEPMGRTAA